MIKYLLLLLLPLTLFGQSQKISDMTSATSLTGSEYVPIVQTTNKKATVSLLRGFGSYGTAGQYMTVNGSANGFTFVTPPFISAYPGAGIVVSTGSAWDTSITTSSGLSAAITDKTRTITSADDVDQVDDGRTIYLNSGTPFNVTLDALTADTQIGFINIGSATVTFINGSGVTLSGTATLAAGASCAIVYTTGTTPLILSGGGNISGSGTTNELAYWSGSTALGTLSTATYPSLTELSYSKGVTSAIQTQFGNKQTLDSDLTTIAGLTATTDNFLQAKSSAWASRTPAQVKADLNILYLPLITGYLGASGSDASMEAATAVDRIPTTSMSVGQRITAIVTISGTQRRLYNAELVVPADATANIEVSPSVIRPNDFNVSTNNKVWREIRQNGIIDVSNYGVIPSGSLYVSDQINAIITAATAGDALIFQPGTYQIYAINVPNGKPLHFIGNGAKLVFSTVNTNHFTINADLTTVRGFTFVGRGRSNATYPLQGGIKIVDCSNVQISDCYFDSMPYYCMMTNSTHISDQSADFGGINLVNVTMTRSKIGFYAATRGEYVNVVASTIADCDTGLLIGAGNINVQGCSILDCSVVGVDLITDVNDAHGVITGNQINHNALSFRGDGIVNGEFIRNNNIYYGDMEFTDCVAIVLTGNTIEGSEMYFDNCTGIQIEGNTLPNTATTTITTNWNGNASTVFAYNNKDFSNAYLSGFNFSDLGTTGARVTKGWFTDLQVTNAPIIGTPTKDNAATRVLTQNTGSGAIEYKDAGVTYSTAAMGSETVAYNHGVLSSAGVSSASIHVNAYYSNKTTLVAQITVVAIKTDGSASAHATVTARYRKDNSGTFNLDAAGTVTTSDASIIADVVGEINGTNPSIKVTMGASSGDYEISHSAITTWSTN